MCVLIIEFLSCYYIDFVWAEEIQHPGYLINSWIIWPLQVDKVCIQSASISMHTIAICDLCRLLRIERLFWNGTIIQLRHTVYCEVPEITMYPTLLEIPFHPHPLTIPFSSFFIIYSKGLQHIQWCTDYCILLEFLPGTQTFEALWFAVATSDSWIATFVASTNIENLWHLRCRILYVLGDITI